MPNHFLTVGLCGRDWNALGDDRSPDEIDLAPLKGANLCALVMPLPEGLRGIVSSSPRRYRVVNKETNEVNPDADGAVFYGDKWMRVDVSPEELDQLQEKYGALDWYDWQSNNWGTKWGTYQTDARQLGGDGSPVLVEFQSAWGPPSPPIMRLIEDYLCKTYLLTNFTWIGHNPYDDSTGPVAVEGRKAA